MTPDWFRKLAAATAEAWKNVAPEIDELAKDAGMDEAARHKLAHPGKRNIPVMAAATPPCTTCRRARDAGPGVAAVIPAA